jgi:hypothetical protein
MGPAHEPSPLQVMSHEAGVAAVDAAGAGAGPSQLMVQSEPASHSTGGT